jgi:hypothetical protein
MEIANCVATEIITTVEVVETEGIALIEGTVYTPITEVINPVEMVSIGSTAYAGDTGKESSVNDTHKPMQIGTPGRFPGFFASLRKRVVEDKQSLATVCYGTDEQALPMVLLMAQEISGTMMWDATAAELIDVTNGVYTFVYGTDCQSVWDEGDKADAEADLYYSTEDEINNATWNNFGDSKHYYSEFVLSQTGDTFPGWTLEEILEAEQSESNQEKLFGYFNDECLNVRSTEQYDHLKGWICDIRTQGGVVATDVGCVDRSLEDAAWTDDMVIDDVIIRVANMFNLTPQRVKDILLHDVEVALNQSVDSGQERKTYDAEDLGITIDSGDLYEDEVPF